MPSFSSSFPLLISISNVIIQGGYKVCPHPLYFKTGSKLWKIAKYVFDYFKRLFFWESWVSHPSPKGFKWKRFRLKY